MADYFEIDFLDIETKKSGDAITIRYSVAGETFIHVVDAGFQSSGDGVESHIRQHYDAPSFIDHVVATHQDGDHVGGLRTILTNFSVGALWMLRPWIYAEELLPRFATYNSVDRLRSHLRSLYPNLTALEDIAIERRIPIKAPLQGARIGAFHVMSPSRARFLKLVEQSDRTPEAVQDSQYRAYSVLEGAVRDLLGKATNYIAARWGIEIFARTDTSAENDMSVVQYALLNSKRILLTADAGRGAMHEAADFAPNVGLVLPGLDRVQVPHHGSRHNVDTQVLDRWLGPRLRDAPPPGQETFRAYVSAAKEDELHPRRAVVRGFMHRGAAVKTTKSGGFRVSVNAPERHDWSANVPSLEYPHDQEEE